LTRKASIVAKNYEPKRSAKSSRRKYFRFSLISVYVRASTWLNISLTVY